MKHIIKYMALLMALIMLSGTCGAAESKNTSEPPEVPANTEEQVIPEMLPAPDASASEAEGIAVTSVKSTAMRLIRTEGSVSLAEEDNTSLPVQLNMRLFSGNTITTELESRAGISLDESKAATVGELSQTEIWQDGKKLVMELDHGEMYFSVSSPLAEDESFEINISNMTLGIRGTAGYLSIENDNKCSIILVCGNAELKGTEENIIPIQPGQIYTIENTEEGIRIKKETLTIGAMPDLLAEELALDPYALERTKAESLLDTEALSARIAGLPYEESIPAEQQVEYHFYGVDGSITHTYEKTYEYSYGGSRREKYVYTTGSPDVLVEAHSFNYARAIYADGSTEIVGEIYYDINFIYTMSDSHNVIHIIECGTHGPVALPLEADTYYSDLDVVIEERTPPFVSESTLATTSQTTSLVFEDAFVQVRY